MLKLKFNAGMPWNIVYIYLFCVCVCARTCAHYCSDCNALVIFIEYKNFIDTSTHTWHGKHFESA